MGKISYSNLEEVWGKNYNIINNQNNQNNQNDQNDRNELNKYSEINYNNSKKKKLKKNKNKKYEKNQIFNNENNNESKNESENESENEDVDEKYLREETEDLFNEFKLYLKKNKRKLNKEFKETFNNNDSLSEKTKEINSNNIKFEFIDIFILFIIGIILIIIMDSFVRLGKRMNK